MSRTILNNEWISKQGELKVLPEKVLQFGTGVLLRGLPDFFIHNANEQGVFNGKVVVIKSTSQGGVSEFSSQDNLFTHCIRGVYKGELVNSSFVNSSISRVVEAKKDWSILLELAKSDQIEVIISNTTEAAPNTFPAKLLALMYARWQHFNGDMNKGWVILPTELVPNNANVLLDIIQTLAKHHALPAPFINWMNQANDFCNTLVDRIVPGKLNEKEMQDLQEQLGYDDKLLISSEPFALWAIESQHESTLHKISFATTDERVVVAPSIVKFRELKLRLLNGTHTFCCAVAILGGFDTVIQAMQNKGFYNFIHSLAINEIAPCVVGDDISSQDAVQFGNSVLERFANPFIEHKWVSIALNFEEKMKMRNQFLMEKFITLNKVPAENMSLGFAAFAMYMEKEHGKHINTIDFCNDIVFVEKVEQWKEKIKAEGMKNILGV
jgi:tagaturonate reductase